VRCINCIQREEGCGDTKDMILVVVGSYLTLKILSIALRSMPRNSKTLDGTRNVRVEHGRDTPPQKSWTVLLRSILLYHFYRHHFRAHPASLRRDKLPIHYSLTLEVLVVHQHKEIHRSCTTAHFCKAA
jgi:hypothetical protein